MPGKHKLEPMRRSMEERFWHKVDRRGEDECWPWLGSIGKHGYGFLYRGKEDGGMVTSHRASWLIHNGPIEDGLFVLHHCDVRECVNPRHLYLGDVRDNARDAVARGRVPRGERAGASKLTESDVIEIRRLSGEGVLQREIAERFGIQRGQVSRIVHRHQWRHV